MFNGPSLHIFTEKRQLLRQDNKTNGSPLYKIYLYFKKSAILDVNFGNNDKNHRLVGLTL